jgi:hypothetical protein
MGQLSSPSLAMASQFGFTRMFFTIGELTGDVIGTQEEVLAWTMSKVGKLVHYCLCLQSHFFIPKINTITHFEI